MRKISALPVLFILPIWIASCGSDSPASEGTTGSGGTGATSSSAATGNPSGTSGGSCAAGQELCDGVCVSTATNPNHCGSCGTQCAEDQLCSAGACREAATTGSMGTSMGMSATSNSTDTSTTGDLATTNGAGGTGTDNGTDAESTTSSGTATGTTGGSDDGDCMTPPDAPPLLGWASEAGGTEGGGNQPPTIVTSANEFSVAIAGNDPRVIHVDGTISGSFNLGSNKTIIGVCGAELRGALSISGQQNIILRNLKVVGYNCSDSPQNCSAGADAIGVRSSHHIWFDHLDVSDGSDGNLDMTNNSDYITISWTKFSYSTRRTDPEQGASGHRFSNLIGASDSDSGEYRITFHHNWWADNVDQRMPRSRFGDIHVFNNLFTSSGNSYCTNAGISTRLLVENNIYRGVNNPLSPDDNGDMRAQGNVFDDTTGNQSDNGGSGFDPPYDYALDPTDGLDATLQAEVGAHD